MILPSALRYQTEVARSIAELKAAGVAAPKSQLDFLTELSKTIEELQISTAKLSKVSEEHVHGDSLAHSKHARDAVVPAMFAVRTAGDKLESIVADDLWPLPTYQEMLFVK